MWDRDSLSSPFRDAEGTGQAGSAVAASAPLTPPAFRLTDVGFNYGESVVALHGVTLTIERGEKVALLGANGCGKSTLLKILNGLLHPTVGALYAYGEEITEQTLREEAFAHRFRRRVGFVFQNSESQLFSSTVRDEIAFGPLQMRLTREEVEQRIADVAAMLDVTRLLDRAPFHLSGGEKKRIAIASVLVMNPDAILLDEPTSGLDPRSRRWLVDLLKTLHGVGKTLIIATHDLDIVPEVADRVVVMNEDHTIEKIAPAGDVLADTDLLLRVNLIHEHMHWHGDLCHSHPHSHSGDHAHEHNEGGRV